MSNWSQLLLLVLIAIGYWGLKRLSEGERVTSLNLSKRKRDPAREPGSLFTEVAESPVNWLEPPADVRDPTGWDAYWTRDLEHRCFGTAMADMIAADASLPERMLRRGVKTVLCVGNGLSAEAHVLATWGFDVTVLDLSPIAAEISSRGSYGDNHPMHRAMAIRDATYGSLTWRVGDLFNHDVCRGPYDAVIERRTVQLYSDRERQVAFERLAGRLATPGMLLSHVHLGNWKPGQSRTHFGLGWAQDHGFQPVEDAEKYAELIVTSG